jgi:hypothetical protein
MFIVWVSATCRLAYLVLKYHFRDTCVIKLDTSHFCGKAVYSRTSLLMAYKMKRSRSKAPPVISRGGYMTAKNSKLIYVNKD